MTESDRNNLSRIQRLSPLLPLLGLLAILFCFFVSLELMGTSMKLLGEGFAEQLIQTTSNPFIALFIGILATSLVQSSSTVTSLAVSAVAGGGLTVAGAIPIVLGANVGTSVTNTIVSLGHIGRKDEFGRAMGAATVHDFFNLLAVAIFFPLELIFGFLSKSSAALASGVTGVGGAELFDFVDVMTAPVVSVLVTLMLDSGVLVLIFGVLLLFFSLRYLVVFLRKLFLGRSERLINRYLFGPAPIALVFGTLVTIMVQSSSITTSITVPLVGAGIVTVAQIFPFVLGANIGTTVTALLASLVLASGGSVLGAAALQVALAHLIFNCCGVITFLPLRMIRRIPVRMSELLGVLVVKNRAWAFGYVAFIFFLVPLIIILLTRSLGI
ncbi:MAG: Na/Pi cotransporter family protein [Rhodothermaceae bacterium]|nr:Na/Pi cotransporter family protein [Rhodothermaceae bacterium]MYF64362.1 Na/Pi cotransporter family protein [Rhodothermaceae bacterium]MYI84530.1 Na/Pi cotransporter family protein [Rhodothermaceae bacterium]